MPRIFISYRRADSADFAGQLRDRLVQRFGESSVIQDIGSIAASDDFYAGCDVALVVIGERWLEIHDEQGRQRLDQPDDRVRAEVATVLASRTTRVIPVLADNASLPRREDLPKPLQALTEKQAVAVRTASFDHDVDFLLQQIAPTTRWWRHKAIAIGVLMTGLIQGLRLLGHAGFPY